MAKPKFNEGDIEISKILHDLTTISFQTIRHEIALKVHYSQHIHSCHACFCHMIYFQHMGRTDASFLFFSFGCMLFMLVSYVG